MSNKMLVTVKLDQRLMMSQQLRQAIMLLQYNTLELKQFVQQCLEKNPLIETEETEEHVSLDETPTMVSGAEEDSSQLFKYSANLSRRHVNYEDESTIENYSAQKSLREHLLEQTLLCQFDQLQQTIAEAIVDAIDDNGYLTMSLEDLQCAISEMNPPDIHIVKEVLKKVQTFDPVGVGSRDMRECLLLQLDCHLEKNTTWQTAYNIVHDYFDTESFTNSKKIMKQLGVTRQQYQAALVLLRTLDPHPGMQYSENTDMNIEPELYVKKIRNTWRVFLSESILTSIKINTQYQDLIKKNKQHGSYGGLKQELEEAKWLIKGLKKRNETLFAVASHIVELQKDFLDLGPSHMKSMNIADVAQELDLHESTISRVTTGKYIATPRGVFELKYFFPSHVSTQTGEFCSAIAVKELIKEIVSQETEQHALSDSDIAAQLKARGINIARRTVAKYREALRILPSYQRQMQPHEEDIN